MSLMEVNKSFDMDYNKQRDNEILPLSTCGPTSMAMALLQAGYRDWGEYGEDPADTITKKLRTEKAYEKMYVALGTRNTKWNPFSIHSVLTWGVNDLLGDAVSRFSTRWELSEILFNIIKGGAAVLAGDFTLPDGRELGHMVSLAGFETWQTDILEVKNKNDIKLDDIKSFIIDDPYGNYLKGYSDHHGMNVKFNTKLFAETLRVTNNVNRKWAHLIKPKEEK